MAFKLLRANNPWAPLCCFESRSFYLSRFAKEIHFDFTEEELESADPETGLIKNRGGVDFYLTKLLLTHE